MTKVFGIGANKTGTQSLTDALEILGYKISHWQHHREISSNLTRANFNFRFLKDYDGAADLPIPVIYDELDRAYPNSKFILTRRDVDSWLKSQYHHHAQIGFDKPIFEVFLMYGVWRFDEDQFRKRYLEHNERVLNYFGDSANFLILDLGTNFDWPNLCHFLSLPVPSTPFPTANRRTQTS